MFVEDRFDFIRLIIENEYETAVEVGAGDGTFSEYLLYYSPLKKLYSIDKWEDHNGDDEWYHHEKSYARCKERLYPFSSRSKIMKMWSKEASEKFDNYSIDFVYLDAGKDIHSITDDLLYWYDKVKSGGIFAGKDYCLLPWEGCSIMAAVDKMCALTYEDLFVTGCIDSDPIRRHHMAHSNSPLSQKNENYEIETPSWWIKKR